MSKDFAQHFFPQVTSFVSSPDISPYLVADAWNYLFPDEVADLCTLPPRVGISPQRPCLAIAAMMGVLIGFTLALRIGKGNLGQGKRDVLAVSIHNTWSKSLIAFGTMNLSAVLHHCFYPPPLSYNNAHVARRFVDNTLWGVDCICTGISSMHLLALAGLLYIKYMHPTKETTIIRGQVSILNTFVYATMILIAAALPILGQLYHFGNVNFMSTASASIELIYLIPTVTAACCLFPFVAASAFNMSGNCSRKSINGARVAILGGIAVLAGLPLDAPLCYFVSEHLPTIKTSAFLNDVYHLATFVFLGCDIGFLGLNMWINALIQHDQSTENKKGL